MVFQLEVTNFQLMIATYYVQGNTNRIKQLKSV